jgi:SagB-type dehydrogenase family enzyme
MSSRDTEAARRYHDQTKHSVASVRANRHFLDWETKPLPFKVYPDLKPIPLPRELPPSPVAAVSAIAPSADTTGGQAVVPDLVSLARLLHFSAGITRRKVYPGGEEMYFRAAACTGALYHIDLYVICGDLPGLSAGVYHFGPHNFSLYELREGDYRGAVADACGLEAHVRDAPVLLACASTYWRNSWKYQARAYRHCFWDCGTLLANLLAVASADGVPTHVLCGFADAVLNRLLDLNSEREATLALVTLGHAAHSAPAAVLAMPVLSLATLPLSPREVDYPAIRAMHAASSLETPQEVAAWHACRAEPAATPPASGPLYPLRPHADAVLPPDSIDRVIRRRGSARRFSHEPIRFEDLSTLLERTAHGIATDGGTLLSDAYLIVNAVDGLPAGTYVYRPTERALEGLRTGAFRQQAGFLGLGQDLPADAAVNVYFLCDLQPLLSRLENRGYRVAQLDAAIRGGQLYLAAYALGLGATGLTFFDDDVTAFFSPHAAGKSVMFLVAIGHSTRMPARE